MEASPDYAVQMHGILKTFGNFTALDHVDLDVIEKIKAGEIVVPTNADELATYKASL